VTTITLDKDFLLSVTKPARYTGGEIGSVKKKWDSVAIHVCFCFPDIYEIGMSHLGLRILYDLVNKQKDCAAERVFSPGIDLDEKLRVNHLPLFSLESGCPVKDFDILGFSLQYELSYTNVLNILFLSGIPMESSQRDDRHPLVIAGGVCCLNPEPMAEFIDAFVIGEAEEAFLEILAAYKDSKNKREDRKGLLKALGRVSGVYVPSSHKVDEISGERTLLEPGASLKISKRFVKDLEKVVDLKHWVVPYIEIVHDRLGIEIMRGCPNNCRFCQARSCFYPLRIVSEKKILETSRYLYHKTGYEEISLLSLSSSDHPRLNKIVESLMEEFKAKAVSVSLPSLRPKNVVGNLSKIFSSVRKTSLTFAPEAGSRRLRRLLNKDIDIDELFDVARQAYRFGYRLLKLYFMIGLPSETNQDLDEIADLCARLSRVKKEVDGHPADINVSISNFVPKPHTPLQWQAMASLESLFEKQNYLKKAIRTSHGTIHLKFHDPHMSFLEAVLGRGDRRLATVVKHAFLAGAKFDAWQEHFNFSLWQEAFLKTALDPNVYLCAKSFCDPLSWDYVDMGFSKEILVQEACLVSDELGKALTM
jgi:radical SAM family uncharacterized protein